MTDNLYTNCLYTNNEIEEIFKSSSTKYNSPYTFEELIDRTKELNNLDWNFGENKSRAVVGNSGMLMEKEYGELIDSHDIIIRTNHGKIKGFEKNVGKKTDIRFLSGKGFWYGKSMDEVYSNYDHKFVTNLKDQKVIVKANPMSAAIQGICRHYNTQANIHYLKQSFVDYIENFYQVPNSTLGFSAICYALSISSDVSIFGFGFFQESWDKQHYFEKIKPYSRAHNFTEEENCVMNLSNSNFIRIYR